MIANLVTKGAAKVTAVTGLNAASPPFSWTVSFDNTELNSCHSWIFDKPIMKIPFHDMGNSLASDEIWALGQGGVDSGYAAFDVALQGKTDEDVVIHSVRIKVLSRKPALTGTRITSGSGCGAQIALRYYSADLSSAAPQLVLNNSDGSTSPADAEYKVSKSDPEVFVLDAGIGFAQQDPPHIYATYVYEVDWSQGAASGTVDIMAPDGKPFGLTYDNYGQAPDFIGYNGKWTDLRDIR
jgi:hypothetical protein